MKVVVYLLLILESILCEYPPPSPPNTFRTSAKLVSSIPQRIYGVPSNQPFRQLQYRYGPPNAEPLDPSFNQPANPTKFISNNQPFRKPQAFYGPPNAEPLDPSLQQQPNPAKFTSLTNNKNVRYNTIRAPQSAFRILNYPQKISSPQGLYGPPPEVTVNTQTNSPQIIYGAPKPSNRIPQTSYGVPDKQFEVQHQNSFAASPQINYGAPNQQREISKNYGASTVDSATLEEIKQLRQLIQKIEAQRQAQLINAQYTQNKKHGQSLPNKEAGNFRFSLSQQYLPIKEPENFKKNVPLLLNQEPEARQNFPQNGFDQTRGDQPVLPTNYLPSQNNGIQGNIPLNPSNSWNNLDLPGRTSDIDIQKVEVTQFGPDRNRNNNNNNNSGFNANVFPNNQDNEDINKKYIPPSNTSVFRRPLPTTVRPVDTVTPDNSYEPSEDDTTESPNVAIATSVAGVPDDQQLYLLHPDGRYQRLILPKSRPQVDKQIRIPNNYQLYQNLQIDPNIIYTPFYSLLTK